MVAIDTSSMIAYLAGERGKDVIAVDQILGDRCALLPPIVLTELLSDPMLSEELRLMFCSLPIIEMKHRFFERAGLNRAKLIKRRLKARLADALIAQSCIDSNLPLVTRDQDFRHFQKYCGLMIY